MYKRQADRGDNIEQVIRRWAGQAKVDIRWQAGPVQTVVQDFEFRGPFQEAVQNLIAQNAAVSGLSAHMAGIPPSVPLGPIQTPRLPQRALMSAPISPEAPGPQWSAPVGASLQGVLKVWSDRQDVALVWQANQHYMLKRAVNGSQSYEVALQSILEQFVGDKIRPSARLNTDPNTGQRVLIVFDGQG